MKVATFLLTQFHTKSETHNLSFKNLKITRVVSLCTSNTSAYYVNILDRIRRLRTAGRESGETSMCYIYYIYIYYMHSPRTCPCRRANSSTWWHKTGGDARFSNRRSRRPGHRCPLLRSSPPLVSAPEMLVALTLCTHE